MRVPLCLAVATILLMPAGAAAHALDEYVQAARLSLTRTHVGLDMDLTPGVQLAASIVAMIDRDKDGVIAPAEAAAYAALVLRETVVELDGQPLTMALSSIDVPPIAEMREGMGTIHMRARGVHRASLDGNVRVTFRNNHAPEGSVYLVNALVPDDRTLSVVRQERDRFQRSAEIVYDVRPGLSAQLGWIAFAIVTSLGIVLGRALERVPRSYRALTGPSR